MSKKFVLSLEENSVNALSFLRTDIAVVLDTGPFKTCCAPAGGTGRAMQTDNPT
jgi:hypothetical protein